MTTDPRPFAVTLRSIVGIAVPMTIAFLSTPLIGITDTAVIGQAGDAALIGAVALGSLLFDFIGAMFNFLRAGTTGLVAQAMGRGDREAEAITLFRALIFAAGAGALVVLLHGPILGVFLWAMAPSAAVAEHTATYFAWRVAAVPLMFGNYAVLGWLLGLSRARTGLLLQVVLGVTNVVACLVAVLVFDWGIAGVGAAAIVAEGATLAAGAVVVGAAIRRRPRPPLAAVLERRGFLLMLRMNSDILVRSAVLLTVFSVFTAAGARAGDVTLAANAVLMNFVLFGAYFLDGLATAAEQLGGRAVGARWRPAFDATVRLTAIAGVALSGALAVLALLAADTLVAMMTASPDVRAEAHRFYAWAALAPLVGAIAYIMDGIYIGATWSGTMRNMMLLSAALFLAVWAVAEPLLGNHGLWLALVAFLGARGLTLWLALPRRVAATFGPGADTAAAPH